MQLLSAFEPKQSDEFGKKTYFLLYMDIAFEANVKYGLNKVKAVGR